MSMSFCKSLCFDSPSFLTSQPVVVALISNVIMHMPDTWNRMISRVNGSISLSLATTRARDSPMAPRRPAYEHNRISLKV